MYKVLIVFLYTNTGIDTDYWNLGIVATLSALHLINVLLSLKKHGFNPIFHSAYYGEWFGAFDIITDLVIMTLKQL